MLKLSAKPHTAHTGILQQIYGLSQSSQKVNPEKNPVAHKILLPSLARIAQDQTNSQFSIHQKAHGQTTSAQNKHTFIANGYGYQATVVAYKIVGYFGESRAKCGKITQNCIILWCNATDSLRYVCLCMQWHKEDKRKKNQICFGMAIAIAFYRILNVLLWKPNGTII